MLTARKLVLNLATTTSSRKLTSIDLARAAAAVGVTDTSVRVAVARLVDEGILERSARGEYRLRPQQLPTYFYIADWQNRLDNLLPWEGDWIGADLSVARRGPRSLVRKVGRELELLGFTEWLGGLRIRPDNVRTGIVGMRGRVEPEATLFRVDDLPQSAWGTWDLTSRHSTYERLVLDLRESLDQQSHLSADEFARQSLLLGAEAVSAVVSDPLLPDELDDHQALRTLIEWTIRYQALAVAHWESLFNSPQD